MSLPSFGKAERSVTPRSLLKFAAWVSIAVLLAVLVWQGAGQAKDSYEALKSDYQAAGPPFLPSSDFPMFYAGAERARHFDSEIYEVRSIVREILLASGYDVAAIGDDVSITDGNDWLRYYNPPIYLLLLSPLTFLSLHHAFLLSIGLSLALTGVLIVLLGFILRWRQPHTLLLACGLLGSLPLHYSIHHFQPTILIATLLAGGYLALRSGRGLLAAVLLVFVGVKPHWLLPVAALLRERPALLRPFVVAGLLILALPFLLYGPGSVADYLHLILSRGQGDLTSSVYPRVLWGWNGFFRALTGQPQPELWAAAVGVTVAAFAVLWRYGDSSTRFAGALLTSLLVLPHVNPQDWLLAVPALAILLSLRWSPAALAGIALLSLGVFLGANDWPRVAREMGADGRGIYWVTVATFALLLWVTAATVLQAEPRLASAFLRRDGPRLSLSVADLRTRSVRAGRALLVSNRWPSRLAVLAVLTYVAGVTVLLIRQGSWPTPDFLIPPLVLLAVLRGRGWSFAIDWLPFLALLLVYEGFRGVADDLNARVHVQELIDAERWLTGGRIPTISLQERFFDSNQVAWYDWVASGLHAAHFAVPVAFGFVLWLRSRALYWRYAVTLLGMFFAGFVSHLIYPAAPPWLASVWGYLPPVHRVLEPTLAQVTTGDGMSLAYQHFSSNPVAALPSLHAAVPALLALVLLSLYGRRALPSLLYPLVGGVAWVYLGEHYFVDVVAGWLYAVVAFAVFWVYAPRVFSKAIAPLLSKAGAGLPRLRPLPAWPLALAVVIAGVYIWFNPLVKAPLAAVGPAPAIEVVAAAGPTLNDLGLVDCSTGASSTPVPDEAITSLAGKYSGYVQGLQSGACYVFTSARSFEPLSPREIGYIQGQLPDRQTWIYRTPRSIGKTYVSLGQASDELRQVGAISDEEVYAVVVRVDTEDNEEALSEVLRGVARLLLLEAPD